MKGKEKAPCGNKGPETKGGVMSSDAESIYELDPKVKDPYAFARLSFRGE